MLSVSTSTELSDCSPESESEESEADVAEPLKTSVSPSCRMILKKHTNSGMSSRSQAQRDLLIKQSDDPTILIDPVIFFGLQRCVDIHEGGHQAPIRVDGRLRNLTSIGRSQCEIVSRWRGRGRAVHEDVSLDPCGHDDGKHGMYDDCVGNRFVS